MIDTNSALYPFVNKLFEADCLESMKNTPEIMICQKQRKINT